MRGGARFTGRRHHSALEWYAYLHNNGTVHVKRYFDDPLDIAEARQSPFARKVTGPFEAKNREVAFDIAQARLR